MELTPEQKKEIERLHENESLTDNLDDASAQALMKWAEDRITANTDSQLVTAAVSAANQSGEASVEALVGNASAFLAQAASAGAQAETQAASAPSAAAPPAASTDASVAPPEASQPAAQPEPARAGELQAPSAPSVDAPTPPAQLPATTADTTAPLEPEAPPRKKSSSRRKKKKSAR